MISAHESFRGTLTQTSVYPREIVKKGLTFNAAAVIFAHNHPSEDPKPSADDLEVTKRLVEAGKIMGIEIADHIILTKNSHLSFKEEHLI